MNIFRNLIGCTFTIGGMIAWLSLLHAQETPFQSQSINDIDAILQAIEATTPLPAESATNGSNFYSAQHSPTSEEPWPPLPGDVLGLDVWPLGDGIFLLDDRDLDYSALSGGRMQSMSMDPNDPGDGDTNGYAPNSLPAFTPTTNDLWLQIIGKTNTTAYLVIHPPWNVTNGIWGLYFTTNLTIPNDKWTWLLRNALGQINLVVTNLPTPLGFFMLGPPSAIRPGFDQNLFIGVDDKSTGPVGLPFTVNFFGSSNSTIYVNENGNVTFRGPFDADNWGGLSFTPNLSLGDMAAYTELDIIAPFWADVDTRPVGSGLVTYGTNTVDRHAAFGVSWINVGYYVDDQADHADKTNSFQVILIDRPDRASGDYDIEFNYSQIQWETGDFSFSGGSDGLGGYSARVGFASTNSVNNSSFEIIGSGTNGTLLDTNLATGLIYTNFNNSVPGRYDFQYHSGAPIALP